MSWDLAGRIVGTLAGLGLVVAGLSTGSGPAFLLGAILTLFVWSRSPER